MILILFILVRSVHYSLLFVVVLVFHCFDMSINYLLLYLYSHCKYSILFEFQHSPSINLPDCKNLIVSLLGTNQCKNEKKKTKKRDWFTPYSEYDLNPDFISHLRMSKIFYSWILLNCCLISSSFRFMSCFKAISTSLGFGRLKSSRATFSS